MIGGVTSAASASAFTKLCPRLRWRESAKAAGTPSSVDKSAVSAPTCSVMRKASIHSQLEKIVRYQRSDRLGGGKERKSTELKEMRRTTSTGNRRKTRTAPARPFT